MSDVEHCNWDFPRRLEAIQIYTALWRDILCPNAVQYQGHSGALRWIAPTDFLTSDFATDMPQNLLVGIELSRH
ncbi:hypothetical protein V8B97DRAFT_1932480 [Scleroderma yunnanense]